LRIKRIAFGGSIAYNNRFRISENAIFDDSGGSSDADNEIKELYVELLGREYISISDLLQMHEPQDNPRYKMYMTADIFLAMPIQRFLPNIKYCFTLHKRGYYHSATAGLQYSFLENRFVVGADYVLKFYERGPKQYAAAKMGAGVFKVR
jgi:hypothetical protein